MTTLLDLTTRVFEERVSSINQMESDIKRKLKNHEIMIELELKKIEKIHERRLAQQVQIDESGSKSN